MRPPPGGNQLSDAFARSWPRAGAGFFVAAEASPARAGSGASSTPARASEREGGEVAERPLPEQARARQRRRRDLEPLAETRGLTVVEDNALWEGMPLAPVRRLADDLDHAVLCFHGDLIPALIDELIAEGMHAIDRDAKKGSTWVLDRDGATFTRGTYLPPPKRDDA